MKKTKIFGFIIISLAIIIFHSYKVSADSGACSDHNGVNCTVGPDVNGNVVCNDGWTNSSVSYTSMNECYQTTSCPMYYPQKDYTDLIDKYNNIIQEAQKNIQSADQGSRTLCLNINAQNYRDAETTHQNCINYQSGLHLLFIQQGGYGIDQSNIGSCGQLPVSSSNTCADSTSSVDLKYLGLIADAKHSISCIKLLPVVQQKSEAEIKAEINDIATKIKNESPEQKKQNQEENCKKDQEFAKNDPVGFAEYKKGLIELGIQMSTCNTNVETTSPSIIPVSANFIAIPTKNSNNDPFADIFKSNSSETKSKTSQLLKNIKSFNYEDSSTLPTVSVPALQTPVVPEPQVKIGFWSKIKRFFTSIF